MEHQLLHPRPLEQRTYLCRGRLYQGRRNLQRPEAWLQEVLNPVMLVEARAPASRGLAAAAGRTLRGHSLAHRVRLSTALQGRGRLAATVLRPK